MLDAGDSRLQLVSERGVLSATHVLAQVRNLLLHAAGHMIPSVGHATDNAGKVPFAGLRIDAGGAVQNVVDIAEAHALGGDISPFAAFRKVVCHQWRHLAGTPEAAIILGVQGRRQQEHVTRLGGSRIRGISRATGR